jgi:hypothetical protein
MALAEANPADPDGGRVFQVRPGLNLSLVLGLLLGAVLGTVGVLGIAALAAGAADAPGELLGGLVVCLVFVVLGLGGATLVAGQVASRRPVLELHRDRVVVPAAWPRSRAGDRTLGWDEVDWLGAFTQVIYSRGGKVRHHYLAFVPAPWVAATAPASRSERRNAILAGAPSGEAMRYTVWMRPGLSASLDEIVRQARRRKPDLPLVDRRDLPPRRLRRLLGRLSGRSVTTRRA